MNLKDQVAIVTGATSGIGEGIAKLFAEKGAKVVVVGRNEERGTQVVSEIKGVGGEATFIAADVTNETDVKSLIEQTIEIYSDIHILINNAGAVFAGSIPETPLAEWNHIYETNVTSTYLCCHYVLPFMIEKKSGCIINIASEAGVKGLKDRAAYCSAKAAVIGLTKAMAVDHSSLGIRINALSPGTVVTPMVERTIANHKSPKEMEAELIRRRLVPYLGTVEQIAHSALYLASDHAAYVTGTNLIVDGGATVK